MNLFVVVKLLAVVLEGRLTEISTPSELKLNGY